MSCKRVATIALGVFFAGTIWAELPTYAGSQDSGTAQQRDLRFEEDSTPISLPDGGSFSIPRSYALVVGIADYQNLSDEQQLLYSERDAEAIYAALISPEGGNFRAENVRKLIGPRATLENFRSELEGWLTGVARPDDRVLVYFAGHGFVTEDGEPYLALYDVDPDRLDETAYSMERLGTTFGGIQGKWKVLLTDSCHSGAIQPTAAQRINQSLIDVSQSVFSLTASRDREMSLEDEKWGEATAYLPISWSRLSKARLTTTAMAS